MTHNTVLECKYCRSKFTSFTRNCPSCGAPSVEVAAVAEHHPTLQLRGDAISAVSTASLFSVTQL